MSEEQPRADTGGVLEVINRAQCSSRQHPKSQKARIKEQEAEGGCLTQHPDLSRFSDPNPLAEEIAQGNTPP